MRIVQGNSCTGSSDMGQPAERSNNITGTDPVATAGSAPVLSAERLDVLRRDGFLVVDNMSTTEEITALRAVYDRLFS